MLVARHVVERQCDLRTGPEQDTLPGDGTNAHFGAGQVLQQGKRRVQLAGDGAEVSDDFGVLLMGAMGEIEARDVHSRFHEEAQVLRAARGRPDSADNFGSAHQSGGLNVSGVWIVTPIL